MGASQGWLTTASALPKIPGRLNAPYQAFAFPEIVPSAPIMMGITIIIIIIIIIVITIIIRSIQRLLR